MMEDGFAQRVAEMARGFQASRIVLLGSELGIYEALAETSASAMQLAERLDCQQRGMEILLDALVALEILEKRNGAYINSEGAQSTLLRSSSGSMAHIMGHLAQLYGDWARLAETIRHGQKKQSQASLYDPEANRNFIRGMAEVSLPRLVPIIEALPLAGADHFVDLGGGPAQYACEAARRFAQLSVTLVDLPLTVEVAREEIEKQGLCERVQTAVCDFYRELALPELAPADVMLLSQVLHAEGPAENQALIEKCAAVIKPGGTIVIAENLVDAQDRSQPIFGAMFAVNMLAATHRGRTYCAEEIAQWLLQAGFEPGEVKPIMPGTSLVFARRGS
jgi:SAM-dependent methyltransferase